jgi:hypothetical protein
LAFYWHNYMYNYAPANYFPGGYWYYNIAYSYDPGAEYWANYTPYRGYHWRYAYSYSPGYAYAVPYYVPVPDPYPTYPVIPQTKAPAAKAADKEVAKKPPAPKPAPSPADVKPPLTAEEIKKQEEHDAARQLKLAKKLLEAAEDDARAGNEENSNRLRQFASEHFVEIAKRYPSTPAGKEAELLMKENPEPRINH